MKAVSLISSCTIASLDGRHCARFSKRYYERVGIDSGLEVPRSNRTTVLRRIERKRAYGRTLLFFRLTDLMRPSNGCVLSLLFGAI